MHKTRIAADESKETLAEQESSEIDLADFIPKDEYEKECEKSIDYELEEFKDKTEDNFKHEDLETRASKKMFLPSYSNAPHLRGRFTSTWVQYSDGLGYAYGGADPLNYDPSTKNRFIRRVFTIILILLMITAAFNFCSAKMDLKSFFQEPGSLYVVVPAAIIMVSLNFFMALSECTRSPPATYICLFLTLIGTCIVSGYFSGHYDTLLLTYVYISTAFVTIVFIIVGNTSYNFLHWSLHIIGLSTALPFISVFFVMAHLKIIEHERPAYQLHVLIIMVVVTLIKVLIMTIMLRIILGSEAVEILEDDYTLGAFYLYTSIFDIYIKIIQLIVARFVGEDEE